MTAQERFQIPIEAAEAYETAFVPRCSPSGLRASSTPSA